MSKNKRSLLTIKKVYKNQLGITKAICLCDCGQKKTICLHSTLSERTMSCSCLAKPNQKKFNDLSNQCFGQLRAISPTNERASNAIVWLCECNCGKRLKTSQRNLVRGYKSDCGCLKQKKVDLSGKVFHNLTVLYPSSPNKKLSTTTKWVCSCICGNLTNVAHNNLINQHTKSCGCSRKICQASSFVDKTSLNHLQSNLYRNNTSGIKGVSKKNMKWISYITFQKTRYNLGTYTTLEEAKAARYLAESELFFPMLEKHNRYLKKTT